MSSQPGLSPWPAGHTPYPYSVGSTPSWAAQLTDRSPTPSISVVARALVTMPR
jgi:hypothetical protein